MTYYGSNSENSTWILHALGMATSINQTKSTIAERLICICKVLENWVSKRLEMCAVFANGTITQPVQ